MPDEKEKRDEEEEPTDKTELADNSLIGKTDGEEPGEDVTANPTDPHDELEDDLALGAWALRELQAHPEIDEMERETETAQPEMKTAPEREKKEKHRRQSRGM